MLKGAGAYVMAAFGFSVGFIALEAIAAPFFAKGTDLLGGRGTNGGA